MLYSRNQSRDSGILGGAVDRGDGVAQQHRPPIAGDDGQRVETAGLRRHGLQVELEDAAVRYPVVASGVDAPQRLTKVVSAGDGGQESEHTVEVTGADAGARPRARTVGW